MRIARDVMTPDRLFVEPTATVHEAVLLMRENRLTLLPVTNDGEIIGVLDAATLFVYQPDVAVADVMSAPISVSAGDPLSAVAALMRARGVSEIPVTDSGKLIGVLKSTDLLNAWDMPVDPLTGLPWQDSFRLRSSMRLEAGYELTLLFFDMDNFGALNKSHGHIVGDRALKAVSSAIRDAMDPRMDQACRFGGDEFVVSTTRPRAEAVEWAAAVRTAVANIRVDGLADRLSVSIGVSGGLRHGERPGTHGPSNLDDLINRASQASTLAKASPNHLMGLDTEPLSPLERPSSESSSNGTSPQPPRIRIRGVVHQLVGGRARADVRLEHAGAIYDGTAESAADQPARASAAAVTDALVRILPSSYSIHLLETADLSISDGEHVAMARVRLDGPTGRQNLIGVADASADLQRATVKAVLDAVNRPLEAIVSSVDVSLE